MTAKPGTVYLVGAGPGDPELITVGGLRLLREADVVLTDRLVAVELLSEARPGALVVDVGKAPGRLLLPQEAINAQIIHHAQAGEVVVRLKGGDPFVFGRGGEEFDACIRAGVPCEVVPGVTSAVAAPAALGIPVTLRHVARSFTVVTAETDPADADAPDWQALACTDTLVIMMGRSRLGAIMDALIAAGKNPDTPAACVESAWTNRQREVVATIATISDAADREALSTPMITIVGPTVAHARIGAGESCAQQRDSLADR